jgi:flagellar basal body-associated protein FliL
MLNSNKESVSILKILLYVFCGLLLLVLTILGMSHLSRSKHPGIDNKSKLK